MGVSKLATQIRLDEYLHAKVKLISDREMRSINAQMEYFIKKSVEKYEAENGEIVLMGDEYQGGL